MSALKQKTISGIKWVAISNYASKFLTVTSFIILARILDPKDFGLFALAFVVIDGFNLFKNIGIDSALIQRKDDIERASHTAFFIFPMFGFIMFILLFLSAPLSARFMNEPALTNVLRILGTIFLISCIGNVPAALLGKELRFRELAVRDFLATITNCTIAITMAFLGFGVWSLVYGYIAQQLIRVSLTWVVSGYKPKFIFDRKIALQLIGFGKFILGTSLLWFLLSNIDKTVIGRVMGTVMVGYYALAFNISTLTTTHLTSVINNVMFPSYAKMQDDLDDVKRIFLKVFKVISVFCIPVGFGLILFAPEFIRVVYGAKWLPAVPVLRILAISSLVSPLFSGVGPLFIACGKPKWNFAIVLIRLSIIASIIFPLTKSFGIIGVAASMVISELLTLPLSYAWVKRLIGIRVIELWDMLKPSVAGSLIMLAALLIIKLLSTSVNLALFIVIVLLGAGLYFVSFYFLDKKAFLELKQLVFSWS